MRASSVEKVILEILAGTHDHLTSLQVYEAIRGRLPAVNPSTVYRALERLVQAGSVSVSDMGRGAAVYELLGQGMHHHLVCQMCGQVTLLDNEQVQKFFALIEKNSHFQVATNHLILFGCCQNCQGEQEQDG